MKKELLDKIIKSRIILKDKNSIQNINLVDFERNPEDKWFPKIDNLKDEFEILKSEIKNEISIKKEAKSFLENYKCDHSVRISNCSDYHSNIYEDTCVLCGQKFG